MTEDPFHHCFNLSGRAFGRKHKANKYLEDYKKRNNIVKVTENSCLPEGMILISNGEQVVGTLKKGDKIYYEETQVYQSYTGERFIKKKDGDFVPLKYVTKAIRFKDEDQKK